MNKKLAVISGGSRGIGAALIREFAKKGYNIATYSRNESDLKILGKEVENNYRVPFYYKVTDASIQSDIKEFAKFCLSIDSPIEVLINNAGQFIPDTVSDGKEEKFREMLSINLESAYFLTKALIPSMKIKKRGHIINICSIASFKEYPNGTLYSISKAALKSLNTNLREELKLDGIKVTGVYPGATWTRSWEGMNVPEERLIPACDVAKLIWTCHDLSERTVVEDIIMRPQLGDI